MNSFPALNGLVAGQVRGVFTSEIHGTLQSVREWADTQGPGHRTVFHAIGVEFSRDEMIEGLVRRFAEAALVVWPDWYGSPGLFGDAAEKAWQSLLDDAATQTASRTRRFVQRGWLALAVAACRKGNFPLLPEFGLTVQLRQLALALATEQLALVVAVPPVEAPGEGQLRTLGRVLEWVGRIAQARVLAILPRGWADQAEQAGIPSDYRLVDEAVPGTIEGVRGDEAVPVVCPIIGKPHPASPGEQKLAAWLQRDPFLQGLFEFNVRVPTRAGNAFLVDLVWRAGKVIVEIDGYGFHSSRAAFASDRRRDAELVLSDFLVLRLPHDEVVSDVDLALDRIRDFVRYRQQKTGEGEGR